MRETPTVRLTTARVSSGRTGAGGACARIDGIEMVRGGGGVPVMPVVGNEGRGIEQWVKEPLKTGPES